MGQIQMMQKRHSTRLLVAALAALLVDALGGGSGLVVCRTANGHLAVEIEHSATGCPTLASSQAASRISVQSEGECVDVQSMGAGFMALPVVDAARVPTPPVAFVFPVQAHSPLIETQLYAPADGRAGPPDLAVHLRSTVLLV